MRRRRNPADVISRPAYYDRQLVCAAHWGEEASLERAKDFYVRGQLDIRGLEHWVETITLRGHFYEATL